MNLKIFLDTINALVKENPELLELTVITSVDDEGNGFNEVYFDPSFGFFDTEKEFHQNCNREEYDEDDDFEENAICVN